MAQQEAEATDASTERNELPSSRVYGSGSSDRGHTVLVTGSDLHYMTEAAIADIEEHGSTRMLLHGSLFGQAEVLASVFDIAKAEYERREERSMAASDVTRIRLTDDAAKAILVTIRENADDWGGLVADGMTELGRRLSFQTGYERPM